MLNWCLQSDGMPDSRLQDADDLKVLASKFHKMTHKRDEHLVNQGEPQTKMLYLAEGEFERLRFSSGKEKVRRSNVALHIYLAHDSPIVQSPPTRVVRYALCST